MTEHDPFDDELGAALRRRVSGVTPSTTAAHDAVIVRAGAIRRRRAVAGSTGALVLVLMGGVLLLPRDDARELRPAETGDVVPTIDDVTGSTAGRPGDDLDGAAPSTVDLTIPDVTIPDVSASAEVADSTATSPATATPTSTPATSTPATSTPATAAPSTSTPAGPGTSAGAAATPTTDGTASSSPSSSSPSSSSSVVTLAAFTDTFSSEGGAITVSWDGSVFGLLAVSPLPGFTSEIEDESATRVRVRFRGAEDDHRIDVRVDDGELLVVID